MKITGRRIVLFIGILIISSMFISSIYLKNTNERKNLDSIARIKGLTNLSDYPKVTNVAPSTIKVGEAYNFNPIVTVSETFKSDVNIELVQSPSWLFFDDNLLFGIPSLSDVGDHRVVLRVWNGSIYSDYIFFVNVNE